MEQTIYVETMLDDVLVNYNSASLYKIATAWFKSPPRRVGELLPLLVKTLKDPGKERLGFPEEFSALQSIALIMAGKRIPVNKLSVFLRAEGYTDTNEQLSELICRGLLLIVSANSYGKTDITKRELESLLKSSVEVLALPALKSSICAPPQIKEKFTDIPPEDIGEVHSPRLHELLEGLERLDAFILKKKIQLTKAGVIRSNQTGIIERKITSTGGWGLAGMVVETALASMRVVTDEGGVLRPNPNPPPGKSSLADNVGCLFSSFVEKARWVDDVDEETDDAVASFLSNRYDGPKGKDILNARYLLAKILTRLENRGWVSIDKLTERALQLFPNILFPPTSYYYGFSSCKDKKTEYEQTIQREFVRCFLGRTCFRFGLVEIGLLKGVSQLTPYARPRHDLFYSQYNLGRHGDAGKPKWKPQLSGLAFRLTALGASVLCREPFAAKSASGPCLRIGADFEIIAPFAQTPPQVHAALSKCCTPLSGHASDAVRRFKLERESIHNALRCGQTLDMIVSMLEKYSGSSLPANVSRTLKDWADHFGRIKVLGGYDLLEFETPKERDHYLKQHPKAEGTGERFALISAAGNKAREKIFDYNLPLIACVAIAKGNRLVIDKNKADLIVEDEISRYASHVQAQQYEINQGSVGQSVLNPNEIVAHLKARCSSPVPADLRTCIYGWANTLEPLPMKTVAILQADNAIIRQGIAVRKEIQNCIAGQLSSTLLIIEKGSENKLKSALRKMGIATNNSLAVSSLSLSKNREVKIAKSSVGVSLDGLVSFPTKQTRTLLEKAIEDKHDAEIFLLSDSRWGSGKLLYRVTPKQIERYSNRPVLVAECRESQKSFQIQVFIKNILALRIIDI